MNTSAHLRAQPDVGGSLAVAVDHLNATIEKGLATQRA